MIDDSSAAVVRLAGAHPSLMRVDGAQPPPSIRIGGRVRVEPYAASRRLLRPLFELAEDSASELDFYIDAGSVLAARRGAEVVGHVQLVETDDADVLEVKSMAVRDDSQRRGVGTLLLRAAMDFARRRSATALIVAAAAADTGNLRFYQRQGFRMLLIDPDVFTPGRGYPEDTFIDGIRLRDRVWLGRRIDPDPRPAGVIPAAPCAPG